MTPINKATILSSSEYSQMIEYFQDTISNKQILKDMAIKIFSMTKNEIREISQLLPMTLLYSKAITEQDIIEIDTILSILAQFKIIAIYKTTASITVKYLANTIKGLLTEIDLPNYKPTHLTSINPRILTGKCALLSKKGNIIEANNLLPLINYLNSYPLSIDVSYAEVITALLEKYQQDALVMTDTNRQLYFDHMLDSRGRVYPKIYTLNPNGTELEKQIFCGMSLPLDTNGVKYLKRALLSIWNDKALYHNVDAELETIDNEGYPCPYTEPTHITDYRDVIIPNPRYNKPLTSATYKKMSKGDKEEYAKWIKYIQVGKLSMTNIKVDKLSSHIIGVDATMSGLQLIASSLHDKASALLCNVLNSYDDNGNAMLMDGYIALAKELLPNADNVELKKARDDFKKAIMPNFYGSVAQPKAIFGDYEVFANARDKVMPSIGIYHGMVDTALSLWLKNHKGDANKGIISWQIFGVTSYSIHTVKVKHELTLPSIGIVDIGEELIIPISKRYLALKADIIHSLDKAVMQLSLLKLQSMGVYAYSNHDCIYTHPNHCEDAKIAYRDAIKYIMNESVLFDVINQIAGKKLYTKKDLYALTSYDKFESNKVNGTYILH